MPHDLLALDPGAVTDFIAARQQARSAGPVPRSGVGYQAGTTRVIPVSGTLWPGAHIPALGLTSYKAVRSAFDDALVDEAVGSIMLHIDSPGGDVSGLFDLAGHILASRGSKPIIASVDGLAASAGYALAAGADRVLLADRTSQAGSIGVVAMHNDLSGAFEKAGIKPTLIFAGARKVDASPTAPLSEEARTRIQADVDGLYDMFVEHVAKARNIPAARVRQQEAALYRGDDAVSAGLADGYGQPQAVLSALQSSNMETIAMPLDRLNVDLGGAPDDPATAASPPGDRFSFAELRAMAGHGAGSILTSDDVLANADRLMGMSRAEANAEILRIAAARSEAIDSQISNRHVPAAVRAGVPASPHNARTLDDPRNRVAAMGEALAARTRPAELSGPAQHYAGLSLSQMAGEVLAMHGHNSRGSASMVIGATLGGMHTRSDFSGILEEFSRRTLLRAYDAAPGGFRQVGLERSAPDFRKIARLAIGEFPQLKQVNEAGEFEYAGVGETGESYKIETFGRIVAVTRQSLVNDDLGALDELVRRAGMAARDLENRLIFELVSSNPTMSDGVAFFHADHHNVTDPVILLQLEDGLDRARRLLRTMKGVDGEMLVSSAPRFVVCGPEIETRMEKTLTAIQANSTSDVNPFSSLVLIVEPRLTGLDFFVCADPNSVAALEYSFLEGAQRPEIISDAGFDTDGLRFRCRHDFGCGLIDPRGMVKVPTTAE